MLGLSFIFSAIPECLQIFLVHVLIQVSEEDHQSDECFVPVYIQQWVILVYFQPQQEAQ